MSKSHKIAVIGAGVSGLIAARELQKEGHQAVVFEKSEKLGGLWNYDPKTETDPLGNDPSREIIHSSVYKCLRTNLPRVLMGFSDFAFNEREYADPRNFPGHEEVLAFLNDFAIRNEIVRLVRFESEVVRVEQVGKRVDRWVVEWQVKKEGRMVELEEEVFEAVVVCNGHCTVPRVAHVPGIENWPGKQTHSHNYRVSEPFKDQVVIIIGSGPSAYDISRDISKVAKEVHLSSRSPDAKFSKLDHYDNIWQHSAIIIFDMMELQSKWIARVLSGKVGLPTKEKMMDEVQEYYEQMSVLKRPKHLTHYLLNSDEYLDWLAAQAGILPIGEQRKNIYRETLRRIENHQDGFRDDLIF